jgi:fatty-acyl-CoA synthase
MTDALRDWVHHFSINRPNHVCLQNFERGDTRTWAELEQRVGRMVTVLRDYFGVGRGSTVVLICEGDIRIFELQFACLRLGAITSVLNFRLTVRELASQINGIESKIVFTDGAWHNVALQAAEDAGVSQVVTWDAFDTHVDSAGYTAPAADLSYPTTQPVHYLFTSGTTGMPKAAIYSISGFIWQSLNLMSHCQLAAEDAHIYANMPFFHAGGLNVMCNPILLFGGKVTVCARFDPGGTARFVGDPANAVTHMVLPPILYTRVAETEEFKTADFRTVRVMMIAAGKMTPAIQDTYTAKNVKFLVQYGLTETGPTLTSLHPDEGDKARAGSCGKKVQHVDLKLVDENGEEVPVGQPGEVWARGPGVISGYLNRPREADYRDDWFMTGDIAHVDADGYYYIVDRLKDIFKSGGENVSCSEVEGFLLEHPAIAEATVVRVPDDQWVEVGLAAVVLRSGQSLTLDALQAFLTGRLARFKQPKHLFIVPELPRNGSGKVLKAEVRKAWEESVPA